MLIYNKLTEFFADFRHICRAVILLIFSYLHYINSINAARWRHDGGGGLEIIVNKNLINRGGTRRRPRCKYQAVHIQLLFVPLRRFSRWETASPPLPSTVPQGGVSGHSSISNRACFGRKKARFGGFQAANGTLCHKHVNIRNSRYLDLSLGDKQRGCQFRQSLGFPSVSYNFLDFQVQEGSPSLL